MTEVTYSEPMARDRTPSEAAILYYLQVRILQGGAAATRDEIKFATGLSDRTIDECLRKLARKGDIERRETYIPTGVTQKAQ